LLGRAPFHFMTSLDNGATWSAINTPKFNGPFGPNDSQPINSVVRDSSGTIYVPVDGTGADTVLYATSDDGKTWRDTGGRTAGRHTTFVLGKDGSIIGYGGKNSNLEGTMPKSVSTDGGKTYVNSKTEFKPLGGGQRPSVIRLASGKLFFVADTLSSRVPGGRSASFVALSDDDGATWQRRELPIYSTCGYVTATQAPNGVIHIVTSKSNPTGMHIEMNEAWVQQGGDATPRAEKLRDVQSFKESWPNGKPRSEWRGGYSEAGDWRLDGTQTFFYESGAKQWESSYTAGRRTGTETFWNENGGKAWERAFDAKGRWTWRIFDASGKQIAESKWDGKWWLN